MLCACLRASFPSSPSPSLRHIEYRVSSMSIEHEALGLGSNTHCPAPVFVRSETHIVTLNNEAEMRALKFPCVRIRVKGRPTFPHFVSGVRLSFPAARRSPRVLLNSQFSIPLESSSDPWRWHRLHCRQSSCLHPQQRGNHLIRIGFQPERDRIYDTCTYIRIGDQSPGQPPSSHLYGHHQSTT